MSFRKLGIPAILLAVAGTAVAETAARLEAEADPARVSVQPAAAGRKLLRLPSLEFQIGVRARCAGDDSAGSISVSIADTRRTLPGADVPDSSDLVIDITIPASQLAPLAVDGFCSADSSSARELLVQDAMTAHLSLRCSGADGETITYATQPLSIALTCDEEIQGDAESSILR